MVIPGFNFAAHGGDGWVAVITATGADAGGVFVEALGGVILLAGDGAFLVVEVGVVTAGAHHGGV